jgi:hypothetical protein
MRVVMRKKRGFQLRLQMLETLPTKDFDPVCDLRELT